MKESWLVFKTQDKRMVLAFDAHNSHNSFDQWNKL